MSKLPEHDPHDLNDIYSGVVRSALSGELSRSDARTDVTHKITRLPLQTQTGKASKFSGHLLEMPQMDSELVPFCGYAGVDRAGADEPRTTTGQARTLELAKQCAVLEERKRLGREIHDSLTGSFVGIAMQSAVAEEGMAAGEGLPMHQIRLIKKIAESGLVVARRIASSLRSTFIEEFRLVEALQMLAERSSVAGRLRCEFRSSPIPEEKLSPSVQHELSRITQEAIGNAIRHGQPTAVTVTLRWKPPGLIFANKRQWVWNP